MYPVNVTQEQEMKMLRFLIHDLQSYQEVFHDVGVLTDLAGLRPLSRVFTQTTEKNHHACVKNRFQSGAAASTLLRTVVLRSFHAVT